MSLYLPERIDQFKSLCLKYYGIKLNEVEAVEGLNNLVEAVKLSFSYDINESALIDINNKKADIRRRQDKSK